jgi:hypothetical protein
VAGFGGFVTRQTAKSQQVSLRVTFDGPVFVTGKPRVPVTLAPVIGPPSVTEMKNAAGLPDFTEVLVDARVRSSVPSAPARRAAWAS